MISRISVHRFQQLKELKAWSGRQGEQCQRPSAGRGSAVGTCGISRTQQKGRVKRKHKGSHLQAGGRGLGRSLLSRPAGETKPASTSTVNFWSPELKTAAGGRRAQQGVRGNLTTQEGQANLHSLPASRPHSRRPALEVTSATWLNETSLMAGPPAATVWPLPVDMPASGSFRIRRGAPRCQVTGTQTEGLARTPQWPVSQLRPLWASVWEPVGNTFLGIAHGQEP